MAISFRRPTVLHYGPWVENCIETLEMSLSPALNDRRLIALARLQRIAEESFELGGLGQGSSPDFSDARTRVILSGCRERVAGWRRSVPDDIMNGKVIPNQPFPPLCSS